MADAFPATVTNIFGAPTTTTAPSLFGAKPATERSALAFDSSTVAVFSKVEDDSTKEKKKEKPLEIPGKLSADKFKTQKGVLTLNMQVYMVKIVTVLLS